MSTMTRTRKPLTVIAAGAFALALAACGNTQTERAVSGGAIGAGVGAAGSALTGGSAVGGALIGAGVGAAAGGLTDRSQIDLGDTPRL
jgi:osmotically inducible lipoprotein OsmB